MDLAIRENSPAGVFNVSTGEGSSIKDLFDVVAGYLQIEPAPPPIVPVGADDVRAVVLDPAETEGAFGWRAKVPFVETIHRQLQWYDRHGVNDIYSHLAAPRP